MLTQEEINAHVHVLFQLEENAARIQEQIDVIKNTLKKEMEERGEYAFSGDDWVLTWNTVSSKRFDQSLFKAKNPDMFQQYLRISESRRFLLKNTKEVPEGEEV